MPEWSEMELLRLEELHRKGLTCGQIGAEMHRSRNAIIGKLARSGLTDKGYKEGYRTRPTPAQRSLQAREAMQIGRSRRFKAKTAAQAAIETVAHMEAVHPAEMRLVGLIDLNVNSCRFPIGDPVKEGFAYCGNDKLAALPYCAHHARMAYAPPEQRRRRQHPGVVNAPQA